MYCMILSIVFPVLSGLYLLIRKEMKSRGGLLAGAGVCLAVTAVLTLLGSATSHGGLFILFQLTEKLPILFKVDGMSVIFSLLSVISFTGAGIFSFVYMGHEEKEKRYYGFYLIVFGVLNGVWFAGNLITFYLFFELLTLCSFPLVLHNGSREAVMAGLKYLFYSLFGAYMALFGVYFINQYGNTLTFSQGGVISDQMWTGNSSLLLLAAAAMLIGFGVKAGMFPMHAWLPSAHPVAPAPASAVLSAVIVKAGVLGALRTVYYIFGASRLAGTWVQTLWLVLILITILMGSLLAYREPMLKKRMAYSTVSQVSYILFGLAMMDPEAMTGALFHVLCHGFLKTALFLWAGAIIYQTGRTRVEELRGIGKEMPVLMWCYTIASLGLIGIPPAGGFLSKWYLAQGALSSLWVNSFGWIGTVVLLISALLTAGYLLPVSIKGFLPGADFDYERLQKKEPSWVMLTPICVLTALSVLIGLFPNGLISRIGQIIEKLV